MQNYNQDTCGYVNHDSLFVCDNLDYSKEKINALHNTNLWNNVKDRYNPLVYDDNVVIERILIWIRRNIQTWKHIQIIQIQEENNIYKKAENLETSNKNVQNWKIKLI